MKKSFFFFLICLLPMFTLESQGKKHELSLGVGIWSTSEIIDAFSDLIISGIPIEAQTANGSSYGAWHVSYRYFLNDRWAVGGAFVFDYETADGIQKETVNGNRSERKIGDFQRFHYTLAAEADYKYISREKFAFYSSLGLGATLYNQVYRPVNSNDKKSDNIVHFNFQITPIGVKYGNNWGGFLEIGFGYRGIVNAGVFVRL